MPARSTRISAGTADAPVDFGVLNNLRRTLTHVPGVNEQTRGVLFGRSFDPRLEAAAADEGVTLVRPADLVAQRNTPTGS